MYEGALKLTAESPGGRFRLTAMRTSLVGCDKDRARCCQLASSISEHTLYSNIPPSRPSRCRHRHAKEATDEPFKSIVS